MSDNCQKCDAVVPLTLRECPVCNKEAGFPNVKVASCDKEANALTVRYNNALASATARNVIAELGAFEAAVATSSKAVMNRSLGALSNWLNGDSPMFYSFQHQVRHQGRIPTETEWDQQRGTAEAAINPIYYHDLNYAARKRGTTTGTAAFFSCVDSAPWTLCIMCRRHPPFPH